MKSEFFRFQSNWTSYDKVQLESYLKLWTRHLSGKPCCKHSSNSLMLFLSLGMSHQAHWSYLCTRTKAKETEYWITCVVKFSKNFTSGCYSDRLLCFDSSVGRRILSFVTRLNTCRCKTSDQTCQCGFTCMTLDSSLTNFGTQGSASSAPM